MKKTPMNIIVVMPAYNAEATLKQTVKQLPHGYSEIILCDDGSKDRTTCTSRELGITTVQHPSNKGYGANQKTLYRLALSRGADVIVMVHPDNQYETKDVPAMIDCVARSAADLVLGTRMASAAVCGMPWWKRIGNRGLTFFQNLIFGMHLSEYHTGLRVYTASLLQKMPFETFSDNFVFDSEVIEWCVAHHIRMAEHPVKCYYTSAASSVNFFGSVAYGIGTMRTLFYHVLRKHKKTLMS